jgi:hypothetical protein
VPDAVALELSEQVGRQHASPVIEADDVGISMCFADDACTIDMAAPSNT